MEWFACGVQQGKGWVQPLGLFCCSGAVRESGAEMSLTRALPGQLDGAVAYGSWGSACSFGNGMVQLQFPRIGKQLEKILGRLELWPILFGGGWREVAISLPPPSSSILCFSLEGRVWTTD